MSKAAQGFPPRRTSSTSQAENPRRTRLIGKRAISGWKLIGSHNVRFVCFSPEQLEYFPAAELLVKIG